MNKWCIHINYVQIGPLYTSRGPLLAKHLFCIYFCSKKAENYVQWAGAVKKILIKLVSWNRNLTIKQLNYYFNENEKKNEIISYLSKFSKHMIFNRLFYYGTNSLMNEKVLSQSSYGIIVCIPSISIHYFYRKTCSCSFRFWKGLISTSNVDRQLHWLVNLVVEKVL